jgi:serine/threonine protein kinase
MGIVSRARDTKLQRDVALKVLPDIFATDPERLARFQREAQVLASLNHPNIAAIYGLEEADGIRALVLELVEGPTLAERLAQQSGVAPAGPAKAGPHKRDARGLPLGDALPIARQIAEAIDAAHERGIVHRDLKPANVKVKADGTVKVLDFGLAKLVGSDAGDAGGVMSQAPTATAAGTRHGTVLGTPAYMSPEQARGQAVDKRTDIWAFGCVLYEMLTGRRAFSGETTSDTIAAILAREPDWGVLPETTPAGVRRLLQRCLEKDPRYRLRDIGDAGVELEETPSASADRTAPAPGLSAPSGSRSR